jgi:ubiquinone/menaquinone biosynthesis C-methylase UbiE
MAKQGFEVYGIDISPTAIEIARSRCQKQGFTCNFITGDAVKMNYLAEFFDFVFDRGCFHSIRPERRGDYIKGLHQILKKNGKYYMICFSWRNGPGCNHFTEERNLFQSYFKIINI